MADTLLQAEGLGHGPGGAPLFTQLSFSVGPGLTLLRGGDRRGKTTLLRILAGLIVPAAGQVERRAATLFHEDMADPAHDAVVARAWLAARRERQPAWDAGVAQQLVEAFGLAEHIDKPIYMFSTGSRRKLGLVAAAASGAELTLIDTPFAALDAASRRLLLALLHEAASDRKRAWVLADYALPDGLADTALSTMVDLGD